MSEEIIVNEEGKKPGFWKRLVAGLSKTRDQIAYSLDAAFADEEIDDDFFDDLEESLIMADLGATVTQKVLEELEDRICSLNIHNKSDCREVLKNILKDMMSVSDDAYEFEEVKSAVLFVGVNGAGKTTTVGKLGAKLHDNGKKVTFAAADTFRAAATEQLVTWADRAGATIIRGNEGSDPGAVVFDACASSKARGADVLLVDTAGRLQNKKNLMTELHKLSSIIEKELPDAKRETLLVLDGTTGQNALSQAKEFSEVCDITGLVLTKLDGSAKGGIAIAIASELSIPVKYIGVGESIEDLEKFDPNQYVDALFVTEE